MGEVHEMQEWLWTRMEVTIDPRNAPDSRKKVKRCTIKQDDNAIAKAGEVKQ